jgi:predicted RNA binding protein YcfA (HicA-like mRNA interferase family)
MAKLPIVSGMTLVRALERAGYLVDRQRGSHIMLRRKDPPYRRLTVPNHKEVAKGTLRRIIGDAGLTTDELVELLRG